jgi:hypothetical protein
LPPTLNIIKAEAIMDYTDTQIWTATMEQLALQFDQGTFDAWLVNARYLGIDAQGNWRIGVHSQLAAAMLAGQHYRSVRRTFETTYCALAWQVDAPGLVFVALESEVR